MSPNIPALGSYSSALITDNTQDAPVSGGASCFSERLIGRAVECEVSNFGAPMTTTFLSEDKKELRNSYKGLCTNTNQGTLSVFFQNVSKTLLSDERKMTIFTRKDTCTNMNQGKNRGFSGLSSLNSRKGTDTKDNQEICGIRKSYYEYRNNKCNLLFSNRSVTVLFLIYYLSLYREIYIFFGKCRKPFKRTNLIDLVRNRILKNGSEKNDLKKGSKFPVTDFGIALLKNGDLDPAKNMRCKRVPDKSAKLFCCIKKIQGSMPRLSGMVLINAMRTLCRKLGKELRTNTSRPAQQSRIGIAALSLTQNLAWSTLEGFEGRGGSLPTDDVLTGQNSTERGRGVI
jgi:hypothetical protein